MGQLVFILGRSGTGKSYSLRNFDAAKVALVNVQGKILPFKGSGKIKSITTDDSEEIVNAIKGFAHTYKSIVVDDFQYVMANEFMRRATERGYDKFTEIARHAWDIANCVRELKDDVIVYVMCHTDTDSDGFERLKTIGKLLDEKIVMEGMSTIVLKTGVSDGKYTFLTQNNGHDTTKSPADMFPSYAIDNDLKYVDDKIRSYYGFDGAKTEEEMAEEDAAVKTDIQPEEKKSRRGRRGKAEEKKSTETSEKKAEEEPEQQTKRRRKVSDVMAEERAATEKANAEAIANAGMEEAGDDEEVSFDKVDTPELTPMPRRKKRSATNTNVVEAQDAEKGEEAVADTIAPAEESVVTRRRRRRA